MFMGSVLTLVTKDTTFRKESGLCSQGSSLVLSGGVAQKWLWRNNMHAMAYQKAAVRENFRQLTPSETVIMSYTDMV